MLHSLYHESLCPDCIDFITNSLWKAFTKVSDIFTITMVPYGNAMEKKEPNKYKFYCQHGEAECVGNVIESCAIYILKNERASFNYSHCIASYLNSQRSVDFPKAAKKCANEQNINYDQIDACANGQLGNQLEHQMALMTRELNPPHDYVPWVTINGVHTEALQNQTETDLIRVVSDTYQCANEQNINYDQIDACANGQLGNQLEHQMALMTRAESST
ncbi:IFI30 [Mytilus coruscus]|uniref:IFI30 n=1 Tax=Mytilus coruscus TaxID=42192 RepID=A0A6J8CLQ9_MYTCO|nr:IFI30 [Mytilus coruscus]